MIKVIIYLLVAALYIAGNVYLVQRVSQMLPSYSYAKFAVILLVIAGVLSFVLYMFMHDVMPFGLTKFLYFAGTTWMTFFLYLFIISLISSLIILINKFIPLFPKDALTNYTQDNVISLVLVVVFISMLLVGGYLKYLWKKQVVIPITLEKKIPTDSIHGDTIRIVALTDLHLGYGIGSSELEEWVRQINNEQPDMVLIGGDLIDISVKPLWDESMQKILQQIHAPMGVYACLGNHEYYAGAEKSAEFMKAANIHLLRDAATLVDSTFYVVGRDDATNPHRKSLSQLLQKIDKSKPIILLDHQPSHLDDSKANGIDLQISGHTHEGQIWPFSLLTRAIYENAHGFVKKGKTNIYVSSGMGIWGGKFRIGTQSEYVVFNLIGKKPSEEIADKKLNVSSTNF